MPRIKYIEHSGTVHEVDVPCGWSVMEGAQKNGVSGIEAECGGACACATCQVFIDVPWREKIAPPTQMELDMLEFATQATLGARLSCQISVTAELDGLIVRLPQSQR